MDIVTFRTFIEAAATGSFSAAAQRLNSSPSAVTERIKQLEYRLGATLFDRGKTGCKLTSAGERFLGYAKQMMIAWDHGREEVSLPDQITGTCTIGCQYALWDQLVRPWFQSIRSDFPQIAFRASTGSPARLNRELIDGVLDLAILYDPIHHRDLESAVLFDDQLLLVTADPSCEWQEKFVRLRWGQAVDSEVLSSLGEIPKSDLILDLGIQSVNWLIAEGSSGYVPENLCRHEISAGRLFSVPDVPTFQFAAYISWRTDIDPSSVEPVIASAKESIFKKTN